MCGYRFVKLFCRRSLAPRCPAAVSGQPFAVYPSVLRIVQLAQAKSSLLQADSSPALHRRHKTSFLRAEVHLAQQRPPCPKDTRTAPPPSECPAFASIPGRSEALANSGRRQCVERPSAELLHNRCTAAPLRSAFFRRSPRRRGRCPRTPNAPASPHARLARGKGPDGKSPMLICLSANTRAKAEVAAAIRTRRSAAEREADRRDCR
jgi:hypothetical protein